MSIPAMQVFADSSLTICFGSARRDNKFDGMLFMCFFTMFRVGGSGFQPGGCLSVFFGLLEKLLINVFIITSIFCISYMEPLLAISKTIWRTFFVLPV